MSDSVSDLTELAPEEPTGEVMAPTSDCRIEDYVRDRVNNSGDGVRRGGVGVLDLWLGPASCDPW